MRKQYIIAHDLGTSGNKATLYDEIGTMIASAKYPYDTYYDQTGWAEQDARDWWIAVCKSTKKLIDKSKINIYDVVCITFSGQMMGCLPVDNEGNCLHKSIIWADMRSVSEAAFLEKEIGRDFVYTITGTSIAPNYTLEKIMWFKNNMPEIYGRSAYFLNAKDYIVYKLTGIFATDYSDASGTNMLNIINKEWSNDIINAAKISLDKLPQLYASTDVIGGITSDASSEIGLPQGLPVVIGGGDGPCATVGAGAVEDGDIYNCFGSSSWISLTTSKPIFEPNQLTFNLCHLDPNLYMAPGTMQSAGATYEWMKDTITLREAEEAREQGLDVFDIIEAKASQSKPGANGLLFLPYLMGERCPYWNPNAKGSLIGLTRNHVRNDILRAIYEGPILNLRIILDLYRAQGFECSEMNAIGGAVKSSLISQIMADIYKTKLARPKNLEEATSFGAAIAGGVGVGLFKDFKSVKKMILIEDKISPIIQNSNRYDQILPIFKSSYQALLNIYENLSDLNY